jgi:hypothetical protein
LKILFKKYIHYCKDNSQHTAKNQVRIFVKGNSYTWATWKNFFYQQDFREKCIKEGADFCDTFVNAQAIHREILAFKDVEELKNELID